MNPEELRNLFDEYEDEYGNKYEEENEYKLCEVCFSEESEWEIKYINTVVEQISFVEVCDGCENIIGNEMKYKGGILTDKEIMNITKNVQNWKGGTKHEEKMHEFRKLALEHELKLRAKKEEEQKEKEKCLVQEKKIHSLEKLNKLIGLSEIKEIMHTLAKTINATKLLETRSKIKVKKPMLHMSFEGNPGTGKTEVARLLAEIFYEMGYLKENKYIEVGRSDLVGQHIGDSEAKLKQTLQRAMGGILFIDEAYSLYSDESKDFGNIVINELIKAMEDYKDEIIIILAGYPVEMDKLIKKNPGFHSRLSKRIFFKDYTPKEVTSIALNMMKEQGYNTCKIEEEIQNIIKSLAKNDVLDGNARFARNLVEQIAVEHLNRITEKVPDVLEELLIEDVKKATGITKSQEEQEGLAEIKEKAINDLHSLTGMIELKKKMNKILNFFMIQEKKKEKGLNVKRPNMHMIFEGDAGTGKTTVARIIGRFLRGIGVLKNGQIIEVSRGDLVGNSVGSTALKTKEVVQKALGGVLFIDEAYSLVNGKDDSFGQEAIDTLIKLSEDHKDDFVLIMAGYSEDMDTLLQQNQGFESRIPYRFHFENYKVKEIMYILKNEMSYQSLTFTKEAEAKMEEKVAELYKKEGYIKGNGRWARNIAEELLLIQSNRLAHTNEEEYESIVKEDVEELFGQAETNEERNIA